MGKAENEEAVMEVTFWSSAIMARRHVRYEEDAAFAILRILSDGQKAF